MFIGEETNIIITIAYVLPQGGLVSTARLGDLRATPSKRLSGWLTCQVCQVVPLAQSAGEKISLHCEPMVIGMSWPATEGNSARSPPEGLTDPRDGVPQPC